jgi:integrator complex subunit 11
MAPLFAGGRACRSEPLGRRGGAGHAQHPTKAVCPILLEDFRKIAVDRKGETNFFTSAMIKTCMKRGTACAL